VSGKTRNSICEIHFPRGARARASKENETIKEESNYGSAIFLPLLPLPFPPSPSAPRERRRCSSRAETFPRRYPPFLFSLRISLTGKRAVRCVATLAAIAGVPRIARFSPTPYYRANYRAAITSSVRRDNITSGRIFTCAT